MPTRNDVYDVLDDDLTVPPAVRLPTGYSYHIFNSLRQPLTVVGHGDGEVVIPPGGSHTFKNISSTTLSFR
jgi:hypothetical protein